MTWIKTLVIGLLFSGAVQAQDFGLTAGFRVNNADSDVSATSLSSRTGAQLGGLAWFPMTEMFSLRTGFLYTQRYLTAKTGAREDNIDLTYFDVPLTAMYRLNEFGGVFFGPIFALNQGKDCGSGSCNEVTGTLVPISLGASFKFAPQLGGELVYEHGSGKVASGIKDLRSIGANFVFYFE